MSAKTNAEVVIDGKVYTLSGYENEEYLQKVRHTSTTRLQSLMIWMSISIFRAI